MLVTKNYDRQRALEYARRWAFARNPLFYNFTGIGGDCTNYVSQCIYAGSCEMNYSQPEGWYYSNLERRSPSWSGVSFFFDFMVSNRGNGPFGVEVGEGELEIGDVIQLRNELERYYHTLLVTGFAEGTYLISAHSDDALDRRLDTYTYAGARYLHIEGVREYQKDQEVCFENFINGIAFMD